MPLAPYFLIALAMIGIADTLYLSYSVFTNTAPTCLLAGCEKVLASEYSKIFGVPLSYIGLVYYVYMLGLSILLAIDPRSFGLRLGVLLYSGVGVLMSVVFIYIQGMIIGAFCQYCLISALLTVLLFIAALRHFRSART